MRQDACVTVSQVTAQASASVPQRRTRGAPPIAGNRRVNGQARLETRYVRGHSHLGKIALRFRLVHRREWTARRQSRTHYSVAQVTAPTLRVMCTWTSPVAWRLCIYIVRHERPALELNHEHRDYSYSEEWLYL